MNKFLIFPILLLMLLTIGFVSAEDNVTAVNETVTYDSDVVSITGESESPQHVDESHNAITTKMDADEVDSEFVGHLKDDNNRPISDKHVSILVNNESKTFNTCKAAIKFDDDFNYPNVANAIVTVKKIPLAIKTSNYKTHVDSNLYFKAMVFNKITKAPVKGVKVLFKVYMGHSKYKKYYATTDENGLAFLKKNFKVGSYRIVTCIKNNKKIKSKARLTVKPTSEMGCTSIYLQISKSEGILGFRRDSTYAANIYIKACKWNGRTAIKQYKTAHSYFFHSILTSDGWMIGTGGADNPKVNKAVEKLAGKMVKSGKIKKSFLKKIQGNERRLVTGHFVIKSPNGKYAVVWKSTIKTGKLKNGQYLSVPNGKSYFRHGGYAKFGKNPTKAAVKILATDSFGVNRRDVTVFHWNSTTNEGSTTSNVSVYAANDNGRLMGRHTGHLKDNIYFKGTFFSKNKLVKTPSMTLLGVHNFGSIDKLIKVQTTVKAPQLTKNLNESKTFDITVMDKKTKMPVKNVKINIKINGTVFTVKTDSNGVARFNADILAIGSYDVVVFSGNDRYYVSAKSTINII
jgi:hypothetical protein